MTIKELVVCYDRLNALWRNHHILNMLKRPPCVDFGIQLGAYFFGMDETTRAALVESLDAQITSDLAFLSEQIGVTVTMEDVLEENRPRLEEPSRAPWLPGS